MVGLPERMRGRTAIQAAPAATGSDGDTGARGLIVRDPYASQLLDGDKVWEIRGKPTQIRGPVAIVKAGTGKTFGIANLVRVLGPLDIEDLVDAAELPEAERAELRQAGLPYNKTYAYVFTKPRRFRRPISYRHPSGAVTWVRLPELDLSDVDYVPSADRGPQHRMV